MQIIDLYPERFANFLQVNKPGSYALSDAIIRHPELNTQSDATSHNPVMPTEFKSSQVWATLFLSFSLPFFIIIFSDSITDWMLLREFLGEPEDVCQRDWGRATSCMAKTTWIMYRLEPFMG